MGLALEASLKSLIRDVADFPKPGIVFKDITPLLAEPKAFLDAVHGMAEPFRKTGATKVVAIESRGFLLAAAMAPILGAGLVPVRKKGKLPHKTIGASYGLEYGQDSLEMHSDAIRPGETVLIVDDVLATGGTAAAACGLADRLGARIAGLAFLIELSFLNGRAKLDGREIHSVVRY